MAIHIYRQNDSRVIKAFTAKVADIPGGVTVAGADLVQATIKEGTPVGKDANGLYHVVKTAVATATATSSATDYTVAKGHNFKVGDVVMVKAGGKASAITAITTSTDDTTMDVLTLSATLGAAVSIGDVLMEAKAATTTNSSAFKYQPIGLIGEGYDVDNGGSNICNVVLMGVIKAENAPAASDDIKAALKGIIYI